MPPRRRPTAPQRGRSGRRLADRVGRTAVLAVGALLAVACGTTLEIEVVSGGSAGSAVDGEPTPAEPPASDPSVTATAVPEPPTPEPTPSPRPPLSYEEAIDVYFADVERFWDGPGSEALGFTFEPVQALVPYDPRSDDIPACGGELGPREIYVGNAFYCEPDDYIAWDDDGLFPDLYRTFGDFTVGLVIAHEYAHAVQARVDLDGPTIFVELHADCLAGAWAGSVAAGESPLVPLDRSDLDDAIGGFLTFADPLGTPAADPAAHGTAFDRLNAFAEGFEKGVDVCGGYLVAPPQTATILVDPFDSNEGNLPLDELLPLLIADLAVFMDRTGETVTGPTFEAPTELVQFRAGDVGLTCGSDAVAPDAVAGSAYLCQADNRVYTDRGELDDLFAEVGDFAPAYAVAHAWATAVAAAVEDRPTAVVLAADCLVGFWARDIFDEATDRPVEPTHEFYLSAGDLDEGIVGLLLTPPTAPSLAALGPVATFDRVDAFSDGFFRGLGECGLT